MSKIGEYNPTEKYKRYSLITPKHDKTHPLYNEREKTLQDHIFKKLKKVSELLESIYPKLADDTSANIKEVIESNLAVLFDNLYLMQSHLHKNPYTFNTSKLKANQKSIAEMKKAADTLQTVSSFENEFKKLSKIKHALHELVQLIEPKVLVAPAKPAAKKETPKSPVKKAAPVKKAKPKAASSKPKAAVKKPIKAKKKAPSANLKKTPAKTAKSKSSVKPAKAKKKAASVGTKSKKPVKTAKPKINSKSKSAVKNSVKAKKKATSVVTKSKKPVKKAKPIVKAKAKKK